MLRIRGDHLNWYFSFLWLSAASKDRQSFLCFFFGAIKPQCRRVELIKTYEAWHPFRVPLPFLQRCDWFSKRDDGYISHKTGPLISCLLPLTRAAKNLDDLWGHTTIVCATVRGHTAVDGKKERKNKWEQEGKKRHKERRQSWLISRI